MLGRGEVAIVGIGRTLYSRAKAGERRYTIEEYIDAEKLPFSDQAFDGVTSTFGVMFASRPEAAAAELARVCRRGGRIALATWPLSRISR